MADRVQEGARVVINQLIFHSINSVIQTRGSFRPEWYCMLHCDGFLRKFQNFKISKVACYIFDQFVNQASQCNILRDIKKKRFQSIQCIFFYNILSLLLLPR